MTSELAVEQPAVGKSAEKPEHPLLGFVPVDFSSFEKWLEMWNVATSSAGKLGLLHSLTTECGWFDDRQMVPFLLEVADGHTSENNFVEKKAICPNMQIVRIRRSIAEKAFSVLCLRFFKKGKDYKPSLWWWMLKDEAVFQKVLWFLGRENNQRDLWRDDTDTINHQQEVFRTFVREFARLGWEFSSMSEGGWNTKGDEAVEKRLIAVRPQLIDILYVLRELNWLDGKELDGASLKKLTDLALGKEFYLPPKEVHGGHSYRKPNSLEGAILGGSVAARIVVLHRICEKERKRIKAQYEKSRKKWEEAQRQQAIARIEAERKALEQRAEKLAKPSGK